MQKFQRPKHICGDFHIMISGETGVDEKFVACVDDANVSNSGGRLMHHFLEDSTGKNVVLQQHFSW